MKYTKKLPKTDEELSSYLIDAGWIKIKEPQNLPLAILFSLPFAYLLLGIILWLAYLLKPGLFNFMASNSLSIALSIDLQLLLFVGAIFVYMFLHEMIHAIFIPGVLKSERTFWGMNGVFGFVFTTEPIKKGRFLVISCMPFVLLSVLAVLFLNYIGYLNWYTLLLCLINAAGSCVDFLNMVLIGFQVKGKHTIISNGFETFYKLTK
ncbi:DUF3267 domain-containing protein [Anaerobium acetethylicum]|uniref:Putative zincin peptidase n=1 Tax=Anaerobium acetethylicum TaxID=1619234 RepID=A0A1D3TUJ6_9FIRM|nr:DUF3267 domain-containing protein [Anaerobium acetethylicum]SCP97719.1 Putative zincin peptidase [Anaerobium acetethylicum]